MMLCAAGYFGYTAYQEATMTDAERFMQANIDALTKTEVTIDGEKCSSFAGGVYCAKKQSYRKWVAKYCMTVECD